MAHRTPVRATVRPSGRPGARTALVASLALVMGLLPTVLVPPVAQAAPNAIVTENVQPGTTSWQFDYDGAGSPRKAENHEIEGYASLTSVNKGAQISLMVSLSSAAQYTMDVYRMGNYPTGTNPDGSACVGPCGGRLMQRIGPLAGGLQAACPTTTTAVDFGKVECAWTPSHTLTVPTSWTTGNYIVKLNRNDTGKQNYLTFVVRDDAGPADIVLSMDVTTWAAYNFWGGSRNGNIGYNLYGKFNDVTNANLSAERASAVSFNRPYLVQGATDGAGYFMVWDYPMVRWLEANGYNVTYATNVDIEENPGLLVGRKAFVNTGHDEYYSDAMRANLQGYINGGAHMGFFSANNFYFRIRFGSSAAGQARRTVICYKSAADPQTPPTLRFRDLAPPQPENAVGGVMLGGVAASRHFRVSDASHWIYAGTGLTNYVSGTPVTSGPNQNAIASLIGYEFDARPANDPSLASFASYEPPGLTQVGHSAVPASDNGVASFSDATLYTAGSGAIVFSAGTMQWSWGLDNGFNDGYCDCNPGFVSSKAQQITRNILNRFLSTTTSPAAVSLSPSSVVFPSQPVGTTSAVQAVTLTNSGGAPLTISSVSVTGAGAAEFSQSNGCPLSPTTLAIGASCSISVAFTPSASGPRTATLSVSDNAVGSPHSIGLSGTGASAPAVRLSPGALTFDAEQVGTTSAAQTVTVTNSGSAPLSISSLGVTGTHPGDFTSTTTCALSPSTVPAGGSCTANVAFAPTAAGARSATFSVVDDAIGSPHSLSLTGTGTVTPVPGVRLTPPELLFASQAVGTASPAQRVTLTNSGNAPLTLSAIAFTGTHVADFTQTSDCPVGAGSLAPAVSCGIDVVFRPSAGGARTAALSITDNSPSSPHTVPITGTGAVAGVYLTDGFESGNLASWTVASSSGGSASVQTADRNSGARAASLINASSGQYVGLSANLSGGPRASSYTRFCFYLSGVSASTVLAQGRDGAGRNVWEVDYDAGRKGLDIYAWNGARTRTNLTTARDLVIANKWYCAEVRLNQAAAGRAEVWLNGVSVAAQSADLSVTDAYSRLHLWNNGAAGTVNMDDVQVAGALNGPVGAGAGPLPGPALTVNPAALTFASQPQGTVSGAQTVTITNSGSAPVIVSGVNLSGTNSADFRQTSTCPLSPSTLAASGSCAVSITFVPSATGTRSASLSVTSNAPGSPHVAALSGTGAPALTAVVSLTPSPLTFLAQQVGSTSGVQAMTLTNTGTAPLTISSIAIGGTNAAEFVQSNGCPSGAATLAAGASCSLSVTFSPTGTNARTAVITVTDSAPGSPHTAGLSGTGSLPAGTFLTDGFESGLGLWAPIGNGTASVQSTNVNSGTGAASLVNAASGRYTGLAADLAGGGQAQTYSRFCFSLSGLSGSTVLAQGRDAAGTLLWEVDYDRGTNGLDVYVWNGARVRTNLTTARDLVLADRWYCAELQLVETTTGRVELWLNGQSVLSTNADLSASNAYSRLQLWNNGATGTVSFDDARVASSSSGPVGRGAQPLPGPAVAISPTSVAFGDQAVTTPSTRRTVTVTNTGSAPLSISAVAITGTNAADFSQTSTCPIGAGTLNVGAGCTVDVTFTPGATGARTGALTVTSNAPASPHTVSLSGTGITISAPAVALSPTSLSYTSQAVGTTSSPRTITVTNSGSAALSITGVSITGTHGGDFSQTNSCPAAPSTVAPGGSCTISVLFAPTGSGTRVASIDVADNASGSPHRASLSGLGAAVTGTYLADGFETGLAQWQLLGTGSAATSATTVNSGAGAGVLRNDAGQYVGLSADLVGGAQPSTFTRFCFNLADLPGSTVLAQGRDADGRTMWEIDYDFGRKGLDLYVWNGARVRTDVYTPAGSVAAGAWHCVELDLAQAVAGHAELWLGGRSQGRVDRDLSAAAAYNRVILWHNGTTGTVTVDDVAVTSTYNGPVGAGRPA